MYIQIMGKSISNCYRNCIKISHFERKVTSIIECLDLDDFQKKILYKRYVRQVALYERRTRNFGITYNTFRTSVTVGSILIPALLSIQNEEKETNNIYWTTWGISILITICNGCIQLYSLDKNYIVFSMIVQKLKTEGWKYFECAGQYKDKTHKENFVTFCENIEKLKMKQVNKEIEFITKQGDGDVNDNDSLFSVETHRHPPDHPPPSHPPPSHPPPSHPPTGHLPTGHPPPSHPPTGHQPTGHPPSYPTAYPTNNLNHLYDIANLKLIIDKMQNNTSDATSNNDGNATGNNDGNATGNNDEFDDAVSLLTNTFVNHQDLSETEYNKNTEV